MTCPICSQPDCGCISEPLIQVTNRTFSPIWLLELEHRDYVFEHVLGSAQNVSIRANPVGAGWWLKALLICLVIEGGTGYGLGKWLGWW